MLEVCQPYLGRYNSNIKSRFLAALYVQIYWNVTIL